MNASTRTLADFNQSQLTRDDLGHHLLETAIDADVDPIGRDAIRALISIWPCGDFVYFAMRPYDIEATR